MADLYTTAEEMRIIAGDTKMLPFSVGRMDGKTVDLSLSGTAIKFFLYPYDQPEVNVLTLSTGNGITVRSDDTSWFDVVLTAAHTKDLAGPYQYQIEITTPLGDIYRPVTGTLIFVQINQGS